MFGRRRAGSSAACRHSSIPFPHISSASFLALKRRLAACAMAPLATPPGLQPLGDRHPTFAAHWITYGCPIRETPETPFSLFEFRLLLHLLHLLHRR